MTLTTAPVAIGLSRDEKHRYSWNGGLKVPGVTSVIKMLDKSGPLVGWAKRETAACAVRNLEMLNTMVQTGGADAAQAWLSRIPDFQRDTAADLGTQVHSLAEAIARGEEVIPTEAAAPFVDAYLRWRDIKKPRVLNAEYMVYSEKHRYGGTADLAFVLDGETWLADIKTGKNAYPETALQLAGLHHADWTGRPGDPKKYRVPKATKYGVLHVRPDGAELIEYLVAADDFRAFLACRAMYEWNELRAPVVKVAQQVELIGAVA